jgi:hypothetical protein
MEDMTHYSTVLIEILCIKDYQDLMSKVYNNTIHVGMYIMIGDITSGYERIRLQQHQLDWLIEDITNLCTRE